MSNRLQEMRHIRKLFASWLSEIRLNNYEGYFDINKASEDLVRELLNNIYDHQLIDLNKLKKNFPGLDLGDLEKNLVAYQVTSRTDRAKVIKNLRSVVKNKYEREFTNGIRFLILNDTITIDFSGKRTIQPASVLSSFDKDKDIIYPEMLISEIERIYETDLIKFNTIKYLLEKDILTVQSSPATQPLEKKIDALTAVIEKLQQSSNGRDLPVNISDNFFEGGVNIPEISPASERIALVTDLLTHVSKVDALWIQGAPGSGKTSMAVLLAKTIKQQIMWVECRDIPVAQIMEQVLNLHLKHTSTKVGKNYEETLETLFAVTKDSLIVLNDLPDLHSNGKVRRYLSQYIASASAVGIHVLITSNYPIVEAIAEEEGLNIESFQLPLFSEEETSEVLHAYGASADNITRFAGLITTTTQGYPLLIQSAARFLQAKDWELSVENLSAVFSGKFGEKGEREVYNRVLENTADVDTRELLYRLRNVIGNFSLTTIQTVAAVDPAISHPAEKITPVIGLWLQKTADNNYQLSPLIKILDGNVTFPTSQAIDHALAVDILEKKKLSQIDAYLAIFILKEQRIFTRQQWFY